MGPRQKLSIILIAAGIILAILPPGQRRSLKGDPGEILKLSVSSSAVLTPDQVARMLVNEDSLLRLIDLRSPSDFSSYCLPGAVNIPYEQFLLDDPQTFLGDENFKNVLYSGDDLLSGYALVLSYGLGYRNCYIMQGGMNEWIRTVMNSSFSGERISARENAIFDYRRRAGSLFTGFNSLPDSLKQKYLESKRFNPKKLDGGCE